MKIAPNARVDDGLIDLVVIGELSKPRLVANFPSLYRGTHLSHPAVVEARGSVLEVIAAPGQVWLDLDGEALGTLPATIRVLPRAITVLEPGPDSDRV